MSTKSQKERRITVSAGLPERLYKRLLKIAQQQDRSIRKLVGYAVIEHYELEGEDADNKPPSSR